LRKKKKVRWSSGIYKTSEPGALYLQVFLCAQEKRERKEGKRILLAHPQRKSLSTQEKKTKGWPLWVRYRGEKEKEETTAWLN